MQHEHALENITQTLSLRHNDQLKISHPRSRAPKERQGTPNATALTTLLLRTVRLPAAQHRKLRHGLCGKKHATSKPPHPFLSCRTMRQHCANFRQRGPMCPPVVVFHGERPRLLAHVSQDQSKCNSSHHLRAQPQRRSVLPPPASLDSLANWLSQYVLPGSVALLSLVFTIHCPLTSVSKKTCHLHNRHSSQLAEHEAQVTAHDVMVQPVDAHSASIPCLTPQ